VEDDLLNRAILFIGKWFNGYPWTVGIATCVLLSSVAIVLFAFCKGEYLNQPKPTTSGNSAVSNGANSQSVGENSGTINQENTPSK
jgi:hypothetical protein